MWAGVTYSDTSTQYRLDCLDCHYDWQICSDQLMITICRQDSMVHLNFDQMPANAVALPGIIAPCLIFCPKYSIWLRLSYCQIWLANILCWICYNGTPAISWPMMEVQAQLRSAIQSRKMLLDLYEANFDMLRLILDVSFQPRHASRVTNKPPKRMYPRL